MRPSVPGRAPGCSLGVEQPGGGDGSALEHPSGCECAPLRRFGAAHQRVHRYLRTSLHKRNQQVLWCRAGPWRGESGRANRQATRAPRSVLKCTRTPARASMSTRPSMLNRWRRPRARSLTRGCLTPRAFAARAWVSRRRAIHRSSASMSSALTRRCSASIGGNPRSRKTLPDPFAISPSLLLVAAPAPEYMRLDIQGVRTPSRCRSVRRPPCG